MFRMHEWNPHDMSSAIRIENEPKVTFAAKDNVEVFVLTSSGMLFNRELFPHDSYQQAAKRTFLVIDSILRDTLTDNSRTFNFRLKEWREFPIRNFEIAASGVITHNYEVDTWHWWFLEALGKLVREKYHT